MSASANRQLLDRYVELYNAGDLDGVMDLYAEDSAQGMPDGVFEGRSAIRARLAQSWRASRTSTTRCGASSSRATRSRTSGPSPAPTARRSRCRTAASFLPSASASRSAGMEIVRVGLDGKIVLNTLYYDNLAVAAQLGLVPEGAIA